MPSIKRGGSVARSVGSAMAATARQVSRTRMLLTAIVLAALVAVALLVPLPSAIQLRDWATNLGPWFPLAFLGAHVIVTVLPFPRTAFTLSAGLLFGPLLGVGLAVTASTLSAMLALYLIRVLGWQISGLVSHPGIDALDARLQARGWPAVLSLRLIPAVPFSVLNYAAGASGVRAVPYLWATVAGLVPGTAAVVVLGDAMTGNVSPLLVLVSLCTAAMGIAGLVYEARRYRREPVGIRAPRG
ncbi:MAG: TVP38/TMEM64 family protein [Mycobacterium sp.]